MQRNAYKYQEFSSLRTSHDLDSIIVIGAENDQAYGTQWLSTLLELSMALKSVTAMKIHNMEKNWHGYWEAAAAGIH